MSDLARWASFDGRTGRGGFWFALLSVALFVAAPISTSGLLSLAGLPEWRPLALIDGEAGGWAFWQQTLSAIYLALAPAVIWLALAAMVRRCHDRNWSGAYLLVGLVPVVQLWPLFELGVMGAARGLEPERPRGALPAAEGFGALDEAPLTLAATPIVQPGAPALAETGSSIPLMLQPLVKYAQFEGRATRSEFWLFVLFQWVLVVGATFVLHKALPPGPDALPFLLMGVLSVVVILTLPHLAVTARRLHDSDLSFAWWLVSFIPMIGGFISVVMMCLAGSRGSNRYGPNPRKTSPF